MKKLRVGIIGVFIFMAINLLANDFMVYADTCKYTTEKSFEKFYKNTCTKKNISSYYRVNMTWDDNDKYTISIKGKDVNKNDEFQVIEISEGTLQGKKISDLSKIKKNSPLTITVKPNKKDDTNTVKIKIQLVKSKKYNDCLNTSDCDKKYKYTNAEPYTIELVAYDGEDIPSTSALKDTDIITKALQNYENNKTTVNINSDIENILNTQPYTKVLENEVTDTKNLYCNPNIDSNTVTNTNEKLGNSKDNYYKANTKYFYVKGEKPIKSENATLNYNYSPTKYSQDSVNVCNLTCDELVKVEYGPPVASMAGLCFEYSVRVTSYVTCNANMKYSEKKLKEELETKYNYCTPKPVCNATTDYYDQAGPNDAFDSCIQECDGGKYSRNCSNKCYKEVYGNDVSASNINFAFINEAEVLRLAKAQTRDYEDCEDSDGCYYFSGRKIKWKGKSRNYNPLGCSNVSAFASKSTPGRYYTEKRNNTGNGCPRQTSTTDYYFVDADGFYVDHYNNGSNCDDDCYWTGCSQNSYLNPKQAQVDATNNARSITDAIKKCSAQAKCSTTTNTVTIKANYATYDKMETGGNVDLCDKENPKDTCDYSECDTKNNYTASFGAASITSRDGTGTDVTFDDKDNIVIDRDACYKKESIDTEKYLTEWTFPGTYLNVKHGTTAFTKPSDTTGYVYKDKNFCLPLNIASINTKWWKEFVDNGKVTSYDANIKNNGILYNIIATAKKFGYFKWNFNINCFFGVNNDISAGTSTESGNASNPTSEKICNNKDPLNNYSFRIVDTTNEKTLFANRSSDNIGYNWTSAATAPKLLDGYNEDPSVIAKAIASNNDDVLDYEFNLTKENLQKIRNYTKNSKKNTYSNFDNGNVQVSKDKTIKYYESPLVRLVNGKRNATLGANNNYK